MTTLDHRLAEIRDRVERVQYHTGDVSRLLTAVEAVLELHKPTWRESWRTAVCESGDCDCPDPDDTNSDEPHLEDVHVCLHCGEFIESADDDADPRPAVWPCPTYAAIIAALNGEHHA